MATKLSRTLPGIVLRHSRSCPSRAGGRCAKPCSPRFEAWVWSPRDGRKIRKLFPTPAAAKGWRADAASAMRKGTLRAATRETLQAAATSFLEGAGSGAARTRGGRPYKPSSLRGYRADLDHYVLPDLGAVKLADIQRRDLQALVDRLVAAGLSGSKVRNVINPIRAIYRRALENDEVTVNPTSNLRLPEVGGARDRVASPAEAQRLLDALPDCDRALWATAFFGGLRRGELRGLRVQDVDLAGELIHVRRGWDDYEGEIDPKSKKGTRDVPIPSVLANHLRAHMLLTGRRDTDLIFGSTASQPFTPKVIRTRAAGAWAATAIGAFLAGSSIDLEPIKLHECRHTYVSLMHAAGCSLEEIGDYVGHSSAYVTDRYRHLLPGRHQEAARKLDSLITGAHSGAQGAGAP